LAKHKATLALELEVLAKKFDRFGWDRDRGTSAQDRLVMDWMDALQDYPLDEVKAACRRAVIERPDKMPNEGHILALIQTKRRLTAKPMPVAPVQEPPKPRRVSPEAAAQIMARAGYKPRQFSEEGSTDE
jgi:hypothetical protein